MVMFCNGEQLTLRETGVFEISTMVCLYVLGPTLMYIRIPKLRHHVITQIREKMIVNIHHKLLGMYLAMAMR